MDPKSLQVDFFGNNLEIDEVWLASNLNDRVHDNVRTMLQQANIIIKQQYVKVFDLNADELERLESRTMGSKIKNISCEELVGMQSALKARAPNATLLYNCA